MGAPPRGPEHEDARTALVARTSAIAFGIVFTGVGAGAGTLAGARGFGLVAFALAFGIASGLAMHWIVMRVVHGASSGIAAFLFPSGRSSPYEASHSSFDALEAAGDVQGAIAAYEAYLQSEPGNTRALRQAAELHVRASRADRAAELFQALRTQSAAREDELYATQRLADLYLGPLGNDGRALVELRRLAERFPGTREADGARAALARLKGERRPDSGI